MARYCFRGDNSAICGEGEEVRLVVFVQQSSVSCQNGRRPRYRGVIRYKEKLSRLEGGKDQNTYRHSRCDEAKRGRVVEGKRISRSAIHEIF